MDPGPSNSNLIRTPLVQTPIFSSELTGTVEKLRRPTPPGSFNFGSLQKPAAPCGFAFGTPLGPGLGGKTLFASKAKHAVAALEALEEMWKSEVVCDFVIQVGEELFPVHRALLVANSDYFRAMLGSKMREGKEGFADMRGVKSNAMKCCLEYIYTGRTTITTENVAEVLQAASIMQLGGLRKACFDFLEQNLTGETCILTLEIAQLYDHTELEDLAREYFTTNFSQVAISSNFCELPKDDALKYILEFGANDDTNWQASKNWIEHEVETRDEEVLDFFNMLDLAQFPSGYLLRSTWKTEYFRNSDICVDRLYHRVFSNVLELSENIVPDNCYVLNEMAESYEHTVQEIRSLIFGFMLKKFAKITSSEEFQMLTEKDVLELFQSPHAVYFSSEKIKWNAALKWIKANLKQRAKVFKSLVKTINFERLPKEFVQESVREEPLMQKFPDCQKILLDAMFVKPSEDMSENFVATLDSNNSVDVFVMNEKKWNPLHYSAKTTNVKITSLNGHLCLLDGAELNIAKGGKWWKMTSMERELSASAQIVSFHDRIYVLENEGGYFSYFDSLTDSWGERLSLKEVPGKAFLAVPTETGIYLLYSLPGAPVAQGFDEHQIFDRLSLPSSLGIKIDGTSSAALCNGTIYVCGAQPGNAFSVVSYTLATKAWKRISLPQTLFTGRKAIATIDNKLASYGTDSLSELALEFYDERWDEWMPLRNPPRFKGQGISKSIMSLCSFSKVNPL